MITPYAQLRFRYEDEDNPKRSFSMLYRRRSEQMPPEAQEVKHHPKSVNNLLVQQLLQAACGGGHTVLLTDAGETWCFGRGRSGQLGRADSLESIAAYRTTPVSVDFFKKEGWRPVQVACGADHTVVLAES